jgi:hypothetical protein
MILKDDRRWIATIAAILRLSEMQGMEARMSGLILHIYRTKAG